MNRYRKEYEKLKKDEDEWQSCASCNVRTTKDNLEPHHPKGRSGKNILYYIWLCWRCHQWVHANPAEAEKLGLMERNRGYQE